MMHDIGLPAGIHMSRVRLKKARTFSAAEVGREGLVDGLEASPWFRRGDRGPGIQLVVEHPKYAIRLAEYRV